MKLEQYDRKTPSIVNQLTIRSAVHDVVGVKILRFPYPSIGRHISQIVTSLPFNIPKARERYPPPHTGQCREYPMGTVACLLMNMKQFCLACYYFLLCAHLSAQSKTN